MESILEECFEALNQVSIDANAWALGHLKSLLNTCCPPLGKELLDNSLNEFLALQDTFEYNVSTRLLDWLTRSSDVSELGLDSPLLQQTLIVLQGLALMHFPSKLFMGRKTTLQLLLKILNQSRQPTTVPDSKEDAKKSNNIAPNLACTVIDTLLCVLVDCTELLRDFEDIDGVETIVKCLKRSATAREVRMKCLEFLYFYLMDESSTKDVMVVLDPRKAKMRDVSPMIPRTPTKTAKECSPHLTSQGKLSRSTSLEHHAMTSPTKRIDAFSMLRKEFDFMPTTPRKPTTRKSSARVAKTSRNLSPTSVPLPETPHKLPLPNKRGITRDENTPPLPRQKPAVEKRRTRTIVEKKEILGTMLGNVDALVHGVEQAGLFQLQ